MLLSPIVLKVISLTLKLFRQPSFAEAVLDVFQIMRTKWPFEGGNSELRFNPEHRPGHGRCFRLPAQLAVGRRKLIGGRVGLGIPSNGFFISDRRRLVLPRMIKPNA